MCNRSSTLERWLSILVVVPLVVLAACSSDADQADTTDASVDESADEGGDDAASEAAEESGDAPENDDEGDAPVAVQAEAGVDARDVSADLIDPGATIRFGYAFMPTTLDPHVGNYSAAGHSILYDRLLQLDGDRQVVPWLAEDFSVAEDGSSITLVARSGVEFADGSSLDAETLKLNIERARDEPGSIVAPGLSSIESVEIVDDMTVRLELAEPDVTTLFWLPTVAVVSGQAIRDGLDLQDVDVASSATSTPYEVADFEPSQFLNLERRDGATYWEPDAWQVNRWEISATTDYVAATNALRTGELDVSVLRRLKSEVDSELGGTGVRTTLLDSDTTRGLMLRTDRPVFQDESFRQAIGRALDRPAVVESGALQVDAFYSPQHLAPGSVGYIEDFDPIAYDPDAAAEAIEAAGGGVDFQLAFNNTSPPDTAIAEYVQNALSEYGFNVELLPLDVGEIIEQFSAGDLDAAVAAVGGQADPTMTIDRLYTSLYNLQDDVTGPAVQQYIADANVLVPGSDERRAVLEEFNTYTTESAAYMPFYRQPNLFGWSDKVIGIDTMAWTFTGVIQDPRYWAVLAE